MPFTERSSAHVHGAHHLIGPSPIGAMSFGAFFIARRLLPARTTTQHAACRHAPTSTCAPLRQRGPVIGRSGPTSSFGDRIAGLSPTRVMPFDRTQADETIQHFVRQRSVSFPVEDQLLVRQLFWNRTREKRVAAMLAVLTARESSRRKGRVLRLLRRTLRGYATLLLSQFGSSL
jgi:hypothetical protein